MEDIEAGLRALAHEVSKRKIRSVALPPLGSGLGGLEWSKVRSSIEAVLQGIDGLRVVVFEPGGVPSDDRINRSTDAPRMSQGRAVLVELMHRYLGGLLDPFVTLLEVHKLMYLMQVAGEPLRLDFKKGPYGPYAENLRHLLRGVEGHLIHGYADGGDEPGKLLEIVPGAVEEAHAFLHDFPESRERFDRVSELVEGFESSFGLELLTTVHWVMSENPTATEDEVVDGTYVWGLHKRQFSERQIRLARQVLRGQGWSATSEA